MEMRKVLGWLFLAPGIMLMVLPFISGFTGFFAVTSLSVLPPIANFNLTYTVIGFIMAIFGYYLIRPKKENILS